MVIRLCVNQLEIKKEGLSNECYNWLLNELEWFDRNGVLTFEDNTSRFIVYAKHEYLYRFLVKLSLKYSIELL